MKLYKDLSPSQRYIFDSIDFTLSKFDVKHKKEIIRLFVYKYLKGGFK